MARTVQSEACPRPASSARCISDSAAANFRGFESAKARANYCDPRLRLRHVLAFVVPVALEYPIYGVMTLKNEGCGGWCRGLRR